jgi:DNA-binding NarL/FixJ family response regulator
MTQPFASIQGAGGEIHTLARDPKRELEQAALGADRGSRTTPLASLWRDLVDGRSVVVHPFFDEERAYLVLEDVPSGLRRPICHGRNLELLRRAVSGQMQKNIAYDLDLANSTVASVVARCLRSMGFSCTGLRVPMLLAMAAHADAVASEEAVRSNVFGPCQSLYRVVSAERPDLDVAPALSRKERQVVRAALEGLTAVEIATLQQKSVHTVTNQLASSFHKLGVGSRGSLLWHMVSRREEDPACRGRSVAC